MIPEILRSDTSDSTPQLLQLGVGCFVHFDYADPPPVIYLKRGLEIPHYVGISDEGEMTRLGKLTADFPLNLELSAALRLINSRALKTC